MKSLQQVLLILALISGLSLTDSAFAGQVTFKNDQLHIDGQPQPQLYGAELQYFRLRGGTERNIPREKVIALWASALDRFVEAKMNTLSFYIPWDFHEYKEGHFDFDGTADDDGDGRPDFPSRDVRTFIRMAQERGIKNMMARPGPYINAEWGFLGFGAIPLWFHEKYPDSHAHDPEGRRSVLYSYWSPELYKHSKIWLTTVYREVLAPLIGPGKPVHFLQIDNETNFMWSPLYRHDYSPRSVHQYRRFLKQRYETLANLNFAHKRSWRSWDEVQPPRAPALNIAEDQDWYRFEDKTIYAYLKRIRGIWHDLGVREPNVLFTLAESYNAPADGLLPHYGYRNAPGKTGMMTVNLYPKTYQPENNALANQPFKSDHDVKAAETATDFYLGEKQEWVLGPEIQGGWWKGVPVSLESRLQTYLTTIGHGMKAMFVYYFNEGNNWQTSWAKDQIRPYFEKLRQDERFKSYSEDQLPHEFWTELNAKFSKEVLSGWDAYYVWHNGGTHPPDLYFDAALGKDAEVRPPFQLLKDVGEKIVVPYGEFLGSATAVTDPVCLIKDSSTHVPTTVPNLNSLLVRSDWEGGLLAHLLHSGINPKIHHWGLTSPSELSSCRMIVYQDNGLTTSEFREHIRSFVAEGGALLTFLHDDLHKAALADTHSCSTLPSPLKDFEGRRCTAGRGRVFHIKTPLYVAFNSDTYAEMADVPARQAALDSIVSEVGLEPKVRIPGADRTVAFARTNKQADRIWITVKTGRLDGFTGRVQWSQAKPDMNYSVTDVLTGEKQSMSGLEIRQTGFVSRLKGNGSTAYMVEPHAR